MASPQPVVVLGLGLMGGTIARHLLDDGHEVIGYDPDPLRGEELSEYAGQAGQGPQFRSAFRSTETAAEAAIGGELILLSLPNSSIMLEVCRQIIAARPAADGILIVDTTTGDPADSLAAAALLQDAGGAYVDATISGNAAQAAQKDIIFMIGGAEADVARAEALLGPLGRRVYRVGPVASGSRAKLVVNHILSVNRTALAEGLAVAEKAGVELAPMLEILKDSAAYSKAMDIWGQRMVDGDHHPPDSRIRQSHKDSRLINQHADAVGASRALVEVVRLMLAEAEDGGLADADNSAAMEVMRRRAGLRTGEDRRNPGPSRP